jgi:N utilization substance protein B
MGNSSLKMKSASRLYAVQALFQMEAIDQDLEEVKAEFQNFRIGAEFDGILYNEADIKFFKDIVDSAVKNQSQIDQMTDKALAKNWPIDRIDPTIRALFRSGTAELFLGKAPVAVIINEFVDIAKAFFPEGKEAKFVNAVLDQISKDMLKEGS